MNAQEQFNYYDNKIEGLLSRAEGYQARNFAGAIQNLESFNFGFARRLISDLKLKIQSYGDRAFPMSEKQETAVMRGLDEETTRLNEVEKWGHKAEDTVIEQEMKVIDPAYDGSQYDDTLYVQARRVLRGQTTRFEAKQIYEASRQERDYLASCEALFGFNYADEIARRAQRTHHVATIATWNEIAVALGYENFIDIECRWGLA